MDQLVEEAASGAKRPSRGKAEAAVRVLISLAGDNPDREGLLDTPAHVVEAFREIFAGYDETLRRYWHRRSQT